MLACGLGDCKKQEKCLPFQVSRCSVLEFAALFFLGLLLRLFFRVLGTGGCSVRLWFWSTFDCESSPVIFLIIFL